MTTIKLAILGAGSIRCGVPVIASLATYFGERPLEIILFDPDEERLDLFDRLARLCFAMMKSTHTLRATTDIDEALEEADRVILQMGDYTFGRARVGAVEPSTWLRGRLRRLPTSTEILDLEEFAIDLRQPVAITGEWLVQPEKEFPYRVPLQILRWLNGEEYPFEVFREQEKSPVKLWLDDPKSLPTRLPAISSTS